ncbi:MAG: hypothetical protein HY506_02660 [Candidatus Yanofskybacteria bacterium]|nr:hypothetical protein [Candidatus Yanofskybacteria bacterium]
MNPNFNKTQFEKGFANIILIVAAVILVGAVGYFAFVKKSEPVAQQPTPTPTPTPKSETADWKMYGNQRAIFEVKYPPSFSVQRSVSKSGGETVQFSSGKYDVVEIIINVEGGTLSDAYSSLDNALEGMRSVNRLSPHINKEVGTVMIAGVTGYKFKTVNVSTPSEVVREDIVFEKGGLIYSISFQKQFLAQGSIFLSTFKFTE